MVTQKPGKPTARSRGATRSVSASRPARARSHSLAPPHLGEAASAAVLAVAVMGLAVFIAGVAMAVAGLTVSTRFGASPPPNVDQLGTGQLLGGAGLALLGLVLSGSALAVLADVPRSHPVAAAASGLSAVLAVVAVFLVQAQPTGDAVLSVALAVSALIFGAATVVLVRPRR